MKSNIELRDYSYVIYKNGNLLAQSGKLNYPETIFWNASNKNEFDSFDKNGFHHIVYNFGNLSTAVSKPIEKSFSWLADYSSFFTFYSLLLIIYFFLVSLFQNRDLFPNVFLDVLRFLNLKKNLTR